MLENKYKQITISEHISLYDKIIPQNHFLRKLKENIDCKLYNKTIQKFSSKIEQICIVFSLSFSDIINSSFLDRW